jgi:benzoyl-CoA reductase subunit C
MKRIAELNSSIGGGHVDAFREQGGTVMGYACLLTPIEIIDAAGMFPFRVKAMGNARTDLADARLSRYNCGYCRSCLQLVFEGEYDFLDGVIESNGCDQLRGMFENWQYSQPSGFFHYLKVPHLISDDALAYFEHEIRRLITSLEEHFGVEIGDDALWDAIARQERIRERLDRLYSYRAKTPATISGSEVLALMTAAGSVRPAELEELLDSLLADVEKRKNGNAPGCRLLLGGAATDEIEIIQDIEGLGAEIVADTLCFGSRCFKPMLDQARADDPIRTLAERYLVTSMCPRMYDEFPRRLESLVKTAKEASAEGVVLVHNKFCDVHGIDNALLRLKLEEHGIPVLTLEKEYGAVADRGRIKTRVQAFMERIGGR